MDTRHYGAIAALCLLVVGSLALIAKREDSESAARQKEPPPQQEPRETDSLEREGEADGLALPIRSELPPTPRVESVEPAQEREAATASGCAHVVSSDGAPLPGAELTWTPVAHVLIESVWDWDEIDLVWWKRATALAFADSEGRVSADAPSLDAELGSVVWMDREGHEPRFEVLDPSTPSLAGRRYVLERVGGVLIHVQDENGKPVEGAVVEQSGIDLRAGTEAPLYAPLLFRRTRTTDAEGDCRITRFPGRQAVVARHGEHVSRPVVVSEDIDQVTLRLREAFAISGTVTRPTAPGILGDIVPRITIAIADDNLRRELGTAVSRSDGTWGPISLPCPPTRAGETYVAQVHGVAVVSHEVSFPAPAPGDRVTLHLDAEAGSDQWFLALDGEGTVPLTGTTATVSWEQDGAVQSVSSMARPDGYINVLGIRPGFARAVITKPGYVAGVFQSLEIPGLPPETLTIVMKPGASVSGRVLRDGRPVPDFDLSFWPSDDTPYRRTKVYRDRPDGTFTLEASPDETLALAASASGSPGSVPLQIDVAEDGVRGIEIELLPALPGAGRVVRASDQGPLADAVVQPHVCGGGAPLTPWGPPLAVRADGSFDGTAFREGSNYLIVGAPGFAARSVFARSSGGRVEFGVVELRPAADLRVEIANAPDGRYRLSLRGPVTLSTLAFTRDANGLLATTLSDVPEGRHTLELTCPGGQWANRKITISPGANVVRFRSGTASLSAEVSGVSVPNLWFAIEMEDEHGEWEYVSAELAPDGTARLSNLPAGIARAYVRDYDTTFATKVVNVAAGEEIHVVLTVGTADLALTIVDADGEPVSGALARLFGTDAVKEYQAGSTNERGEYRFRSLGRGRYLLHVTHPALGLLSDVEITVDSDEPFERELVLDGSAALDLLLVDDDHALPGLTCKLLDESGNDLTAAVLSNDQGRAQIPRLTPGVYRLSVTGDAVWPVSLDVDVQKGAGLRSLDVRRRGDVVIRVLAPEGPPVLGVEVVLADQLTGELVSDWLAAGLITGPAELTSDKHGEVALAGLPHGAYVWRLGAAAGMLTVAAGKESLVLLVAE